MSQFEGKWRFVSCENSEAFFAAVNAADEFVQLFASVEADFKGGNADAAIEDIHFDKASNIIQRNLYIKGEKMNELVDHPVGVEYEGRCHGNPAKMLLTIESDNKLVRQEKGDNFTSTSTAEVNGSDLTMTLRSGSVTATEKYKKV